MANDDTNWAYQGADPNPKETFRSDAIWSCDSCTSTPAGEARRLLPNEDITRGGNFGNETCGVCSTRGELRIP